LNIPSIWKFVQGDLGGILAWGFFLNSSRLLKDFRKIKYAMSCNGSYARLFLEGFSYARQTDMQPICTPMLAKFYSCKMWVLQGLPWVEDGNCIVHHCPEGIKLII
jgi:hypothetical protein